MSVTVTQNEDKSFTVSIDGTVVDLPKDSKKFMQKGNVAYGTKKNHLVVDTYMHEITHVTPNTRDVVVPGDEGGEDTAEGVAVALEESWTNRNEPDGGSRIKHQTRRAKRNARGNKRRKTRKLSTRRR